MQGYEHSSGAAVAVMTRLAFGFGQQEKHQSQLNDEHSRPINFLSLFAFFCCIEVLLAKQGGSIQN